MTFEVVDPDDETYATYSANFDSYNRQHAPWDWHSFSVVLRQSERITAGGRGIVNMGALEVRGLWVDLALRGSGIGAQLLSAIEEEGRRRGASRAMLHTFSWQAESFYRKQGYLPYARFQFPAGPERIDFQKEI